MIEKNSIEETMNGIEKEVDRLGRVVIPVEFRKNSG
jgi:bifunctional DNA-binding transcriptional regulator/antitoxin component of YhaV-PrlF toxin-antitoxin module